MHQLMPGRARAAAARTRKLTPPRPPRPPLRVLPGSQSLAACYTEVDNITLPGVPGIMNFQSLSALVAVLLGRREGLNEDAKHE